MEMPSPNCSIPGSGAAFPLPCLPGVLAISGLDSNADRRRPTEAEQIIFLFQTILRPQNAINLSLWWLQKWMESLKVQNSFWSFREAIKRYQQIPKPRNLCFILAQIFPWAEYSSPHWPEHCPKSCAFPASSHYTEDILHFYTWSRAGQTCYCHKNFAHCANRVLHYWQSRVGKWCRGGVEWDGCGTTITYTFVFPSPIPTHTAPH